MKTEQQITEEMDKATEMVSEFVAQLLNAGFNPAAIGAGLTDALGVMLAAAPRHRIDAVERATMTRLRERRLSTWAEVDSAIGSTAAAAAVTTH